MNLVLFFIFASRSFWSFTALSSFKSKFLFFPKGFCLWNVFSQIPSSISRWNLGVKAPTLWECQPKRRLTSFHCCSWPRVRSGLGFRAGSSEASPFSTMLWSAGYHGVKVSPFLFSAQLGLDVHLSWSNGRCHECLCSPSMTSGKEATGGSCSSVSIISSWKNFNAGKKNQSTITSFVKWVLAQFEITQ